jgi:hypothetical protein
MIFSSTKIVVIIPVVENEIFQEIDTVGTGYLLPDLLFSNLHSFCSGFGLNCVKKCGFKVQTGIPEVHPSLKKGEEILCLKILITKPSFGKAVGFVWSLKFDDGCLLKKQYKLF